MTADSSVRIEALLAHRGWVRALAGVLVADDAQADDLAQQVWLEALERPPAHGGALRAWFARIVRRRARDAWRDDGRRSVRETACADRGDAPSTVSVVVEAEAHRRVVVAVMELDEPYRETVLLRFFESLAPRQVAERMRVPVETVRTRTRRAVDELRKRLDEESRGRHAAWLAPLFRPERRRPTPTSIGLAAGGAMTMASGKTVALAAAAVLLLLVGGGIAVQRRNAPRAAGEEATATDPVDSKSAAVRRPRTRVVDAAPADASSKDVATPDATAAPTTTARPARDLAVVVVDPNREPVAGVRVHLNVRGGPPGAAPVEATDENGRAKFHVVGDIENAWAADEGADGRAWRQKGGSVRVAADAAEARLVVERREWIRGHVAGEDGQPIYQAEVRAIVAGRHVWNGWSDSKGAFKIPVPPGGTYDIVLEGLAVGRSRTESAPDLVAEVQGVAAGADDVKLVAHVANGTGAVHVRTVTADGRTLAGVWISVASPTTWAHFASGLTDADGRFACADVPDRRVRVAVETNWMEVEPWQEAGWIAPAWESFVRPSEDEVTLVFETGRPMRGRVEFPENYPLSAAPGSPRALVNVEDDSEVVSRAYSDANRRFTVWVPTRCAGPFRLVCGSSGDVEGKHRSFNAAVDGVLPDAQDVVLRIVEAKR